MFNDIDDFILLVMKITQFLTLILWVVEFLIVSQSDH